MLLVTAQNFNNSSTQGVIMVTVNTQAAESNISLKDSDGNELLSWSSDKEYTSVIVSCPAITQGTAYTLTAGNITQEITMDSLVYGSGRMNGQPGRNIPGNEGQMSDQPERNVPGNEWQTGDQPERNAPENEGQMSDQPGNVASGTAGQFSV